MAYPYEQIEEIKNLRQFLEASENRESDLRAALEAQVKRIADLEAKVSDFAYWANNNGMKGIDYMIRADAAEKTNASQAQEKI